MTLAVEDTAPGVSRKTVLVVEDEVGLRFLIAMVLREDAGLTVVEAQNADEALAVLRSGVTVSVMFTDVRMPGSMSGTELIRRVRADYPDIKVMMTSGNLTQDERIPNVPLFTKPYDIDQVRAHIVTMIEG